jgi:hypothetical protein
MESVERKVVMKWLGLYGVIGLVISQLIAFQIDYRGGFDLSNQAYLTFTIFWVVISWTAVAALAMWLAWRVWLLARRFIRAVKSQSE